MPSRLARPSSSFSIASRVGSALAEPTSRSSAFFDRSAAFSNVPPMPTPRTSGGHASGPAVFTHSMMKSFTPSTPAAGVNMVYFYRFSQPPPLAMIASLSRAPGGQRPVEGAEHVGLELEVRADTELLDRVDDRADVDVSHDG